MRLLLFLVLLFLSCSALATEQLPVVQPAPVELEFSGYQFGKSPAANMTCYSGYCKSQAPGGDGRIDFPFSVYETPGAVSSLGTLVIVNPRYTFWDDHLYRVLFQVDCTPREADECLADIVGTLNREYGLTPVASSDTQQFNEERRVIIKDFRTDSGAFIRVRYSKLKDAQARLLVDIIDQETAKLVVSSVVPEYKLKQEEFIHTIRKP